MRLTTQSLKKQLSVQSHHDSAKSANTKQPLLPKLVLAWLAGAAFIFALAPYNYLLLPRHPSQLYQAFTEGVVLFVLVWWFASRPRPRMAVSGLFVMGYGIARFITEFFRQPDADQGFILLGWMTKGQILSLPMIIGGLVLLIWAYKNQIYDWGSQKNVD